MHFYRETTKKNRTFILKPESGCQGKGIIITRTLKEIQPGDRIVCQQYISQPFLLDGYKVDFRLYVLVTSCDPFRIYLYKDGLARLATVKYKEPTAKNIADVFVLGSQKPLFLLLFPSDNSPHRPLCSCQHLTNYSINKSSSTFERGDDSNANAGTKRKVCMGRGRGIQEKVC